MFTDKIYSALGRDQYISRGDGEKVSKDVKGDSKDLSGYPQYDVSFADCLFFVSPRSSLCAGAKSQHPIGRTQHAIQTGLPGHHQ